VLGVDEEGGALAGVVHVVDDGGDERGHGVAVLHGVLRIDCEVWEEPEELKTTDMASEPR